LTVAGETVDPGFRPGSVFRRATYFARADSETADILTGLTIRSKWSSAPAVREDAFAGLSRARPT
jgi:hypothetical protein